MGLIPPRESSVIMPAEIRLPLPYRELASTAIAGEGVSTSEPFPAANPTGARPSSSTGEGEQGYREEGHTAEGGGPTVFDCTEVRRRTV